jgi:hypothetical protein
MPTDYLVTSPSGAPRIVPTDPNGNPVAVTYFYKNGESDPVPAGNYAESLLVPSGVIYGASGVGVQADGRQYSTPIRNIGQYNTAILNLDVHALTRDDSNETLAVAIETSFDNGYNWHRIAGFKTVSSTGKSSQTLKIAPSGGFDLSENLNMTKFPSAAIIPSGTVLFPYFGDLMRVSAEFIDPAGADASGIYSVYGAFKK